MEHCLIEDSASIRKWYSFPNASISYGELFYFLCYLYAPFNKRKQSSG